MWYAGIDWADQHHDVVVLDEGAKIVKSIRVRHNAQGMEQLNTFLQQISGPANKEQMACIIETNQGLLISMLLEKGWPVYPVNPRTVDRHRSPSVPSRFIGKHMKCFSGLFISHCLSW